MFETFQTLGPLVIPILALLIPIVATVSHAPPRLIRLVTVCLLPSNHPTGSKLREATGQFG